MMKSKADVTVHTRTEFRWTIPFYLLFPYSSPYKIIKVWLKLFHFASCALSIFMHDIALSLTWARRHKIAWISTKSLKSCCWVCDFLREKCASFIPTLLLAKRLLSADWWESIGDVKCDNWQFAAGTHKSRLKKINEAIWKAMEISS